MAGQTGGGLLPHDHSGSGEGGGSLSPETIATEQVHNLILVTNDQDLQAVYNDAGLDTVLYIAEEHEVGSTVTLDRGAGPVVWFAAPVVPTADVVPIEITGKQQTIIGSRSTSAVKDVRDNTTAGTPGMHIRASTYSIGPIEARAMGGHGVFLEQQTGDNLNNSDLHLTADANGEDGVRVENSTGNSPNLNRMSLKVEAQNNGGAGFKLLDGVQQRLHIHSENNTGRAYEIQGTGHLGWIAEERNGSNGIVGATASRFRAVRGAIPSTPKTTAMIRGSSYRRAAGAKETYRVAENPSADASTEGIALEWMTDSGNGTWRAFMRGDGVMDFEGDTHVPNLRTGRTWQDEAANRSAGTTFSNGFGRDIGVSIIWQADADATEIYSSLNVDGVRVDGCRLTCDNNERQSLQATVPVGGDYNLSKNGDSADYSLRTWAEFK